jgi:shikimate kinase
MRVFLIGFMGSGKTYWGKQLADKLQMPFFDLDMVVTQTENKSISEIFSEYGEEYFRRKERANLEKLIDDNTSMILSCGGGTPCFFNNIELMKKYGTVVWLNTDVDILVKRLLLEKNQRPLLKSIADDEMKSFIIRKLNERRMYYQQSDITLDNESKLSTNEFIQTILHA